MAMHPAPGTIVKPVGVRACYLFCLEILSVVFYEGHAQWECKRWGLKDGRPYADAGPRNTCYVTGPEPAAPGVWKDHKLGWCGPVYWRQIGSDFVVSKEQGQLEMFG